MKLTLLRYNPAPFMTQGILLDSDKYLCDTLELPWQDNHVDHSSIPEGTYPIELAMTTHLGACISVQNVPGRTGIFVHAANKVSQLLGCIAVGSKCGNNVNYSENALDSVMKEVAVGSTLEVLNLVETNII